VASRSGGDEESGPVGKEGKSSRLTDLEFFRLDQPEDERGVEVSVHLRVSYKTILLVAVIFSAVFRISDEIIVPAVELIL